MRFQAMLAQGCKHGTPHLAGLGDQDAVVPPVGLGRLASQRSS